jgi:hypothetical protein
VALTAPARSDRLRRVTEVNFDALKQIVAAMADRFFRQQDQTALSPDVTDAFAERLVALIRVRGLPRPLAPGDTGAPGSLPEAEIAACCARLLEVNAPPLLAEFARQLVKACWYPEFTTCRDSYRETKRDGICRRQELGRVRSRISGAHCVDCPHWIQLDEDEHRQLLAAAWRGAPELLAHHREVFLPEDFRQLREWLHHAARTLR